MTRTDTDQLALAFARICNAASGIVMQVYNSDFETRQKSDASPVTQADEAAEAIILEALAKTLPGVPILAEESFEAGIKPSIGSEFLLVDPVDGTKEFINKNGQFTINIALISNRAPIAGAVYAPALNRIFLGGRQAFCGDLEPGSDALETCLIAANARRFGSEPRTAVMSRSHADEQTLAFAKAEGITETISAGSSLKFCMLAEGKADLYPRFGPTMEWDTAAGHAVLNAAGGRVENPDGTPFCYGKVETGFLNGPFIARGRVQGRA